MGDYSQSGRVALVTGAGQGVGEGVALSLGAVGALVVVNDLHLDRAEAVVAVINERGGKAVPATFDATDLDEVIGAVARVEAAVGPIDILVNNVGGGVTSAGVSERFKDSDPKNWDTWLERNLFASLYVTRAVLPGMVDRGWGRVVQISSGAGSRGHPFGLALYGAGKAGVEGALRHIAMEEAKSGVTLNAIALGMMSNNAGNPDREGEPDKATVGTLAGIPMGRFGEPDEIGACVVWLTSELASYVTAQVIHVNGGTFQGR